MKTLRQLSALQSTVHIAAPAHYATLDAAGRRAFVEHELGSGKHHELDALETPDLLYLGSAIDTGIPDYFLYRVLLGRKDPAAVVNYLNSEVDHLLFIDAFGFERARPHKSVECWLDIYSLMHIFSDFEGASKNEVRKLIESHGAEAVADEVKTVELGEVFVEIFGIKTVSLVPKDIASQIKGRHLEDQLGL